MDKVNGQIIDVLNQVQLATMSPQVVLTSGAGKAYQAVAQSTAIAMAQYLATGDEKYAKVMAQAQLLMQGATQDFAKVGAAAAQVLEGFPAG